VQPRGMVKGATMKCRADAFFTLIVAGEIDELALLQTRVPHVFGIHEDDAPSVEDAAIAIAEAIDRGVELVVRTNRHHDVLARPDRERLDLGNDEFRLPFLVVEFALIARFVGQIEDVAPDAGIEVFQARHDVLDVIANVVVVGGDLSQSTVVRVPSVARASRATMAGSLSRCVLAGLKWPRDGLMMPIESSTVTNCSPSAWESTSERPRHGRMSATSPVMRCERLSLVETCAVTRHFCSALAVNSVSGVAERKLPPIPRKKRIFPCRMCLIASTVSTPCFGGGVKWNSSPSLPMNSSFMRSQMPIVRSPCTLE